MKKIFLTILVFSGFMQGHEEERLNVTVQAHKTKAIPVTIALVGTPCQELKEIGACVVRLLEFSGLCDPNVIEMPEHPHKKAISALQDKALLLVIIEDKDKYFDIRTYKTRNAEFVKGERVEKITNAVHALGNCVADEVMVQLTGLKGCASSLIAFCKRDSGAKERTKLCVMDYDGSHVHTLATMNSIAVTPRWNNDSENPFILYSEYGVANLPLMLVDLKGYKRPAVSFEGINMQAAFSPRGDRVLVCLSVEGSTHIYRCVKSKHKRKFVRLTNGEGNNLAPVFIDEHTIVYCSDGEKKKPYIYTMRDDGSDKQQLSLGMAVSPTYSPVLHKVAYIQFINGAAQIMLHDLATHTVTQITDDRVHKEQLSFSPCGNYLVFTLRYDGKQRIAVQSLLTKKRRCITPEDQLCNYPCWSGTFIQPW